MHTLCSWEISLTWMIIYLTKVHEPESYFALLAPRQAIYLNLKSKGVKIYVVNSLLGIIFAKCHLQSSRQKKEALMMRLLSLPD